MKDFITNISTNQITFWIAVAGFVMSLATWIKDLLTQRKRLATHVLHLKVVKDELHMYLLIENRSRLPISVTRLELIQGNVRTACTALPSLMFRRYMSSGGTGTDERRDYSTPLPYSLSSLGAMTVLVRFEDLKQTPPLDATHLTLAVSTNRGRKVRMKLELPPGWADQRIPLL